MFDKNDFINWVETAQKDNTTMQDFRSYHSNPMKQVNEGWGTVVKKGAPLVAKGAKAVVPIVTSAAKEVGQGAAIGAGMAGIRKATDIVKKKLKRQEPDEVQEQPGEHASYETRKEAGMRAMSEFFGHQKKLGLGKDQIKQRAKQSQDAYGHSSSSGFKFGRPLAHQEPKEKPKV